jgi:flagellar export protein FliJ
MKNFQFPLARVMDWRRTRARVEEAALEKLYAELRALEIAAAQIRDDQSQAENKLYSAPAVTGAELAGLGDFKRWVKTECTRLEQAAAACQKRVAVQMEQVVLKRRDLRLLEQLHDRKLAEWKKDLAKEIDQQAEELNLGKLAGRIQARRN